MEQDAYFFGDVRGFVDSFAADAADLVAPGFRVAGPRWWQWAERVTPALMLARPPLALVDRASARLARTRRFTGAILLLVLGKESGVCDRVSVAGSATI